MPEPRLVRARVAVSAVFAVHGAVGGCFATRIPWIADRLHLTPAALGLALLAPAVGAMVTMPLAGRLVHRYRSRTVLRALMAAWCAALALPALAPNLALLWIALLVYGATAGMADVAMNAEGVVVEQRYGRSIMSGLHGMWSVGALVGSGIGALFAHAGTDARLHLGISAAVLLALGWVAGTDLLDVRLPGTGALTFALPSRGVLLIGLVGFCAVFAESASADWCAVYLRGVTGAEPGTAAAGFTAFAFTMAGGRLVGDRVIRRLGAVASVRLGGLVAAAGGVLVVAAQTAPYGILGFALLGLGVAVVVPLAFAAAGTTGVNPGQAIAGVATIAYGSGLAAPATIGGIADLTSLRVSFTVVSALCLLVTLGAAVVRPGRSVDADLLEASPGPV
ncbi:MAG TPA: MFS transporter [Micromonosporaceae bacterium]